MVVAVLMRSRIVQVHLDELVSCTTRTPLAGTLVMHFCVTRSVGPGPRKQVSRMTSLVDLHSSVAVATRKEAEPKMARSATLDSCILPDALRCSNG